MIILARIRLTALFFVPVCAVVLQPETASAYTGPGLGMGALSVAFGVLGSLFLGIVAVIWYPVKRLFRAFRAKQNVTDDVEELPPE